MKTDSPFTPADDPFAGASKEMLDLAALAAAALAPAVAVPDALLAGASVRIKRRAMVRRTGRQAVMWGGWAAAAAACLTLWLRSSAAGTVPGGKSGGDRGHGPGVVSHHEENGVEAASPGGDGPRSDGPGGMTERRAPRVSPRGQFRTLPGSADFPEGGDADQLRREMRRLTDSQAARFQPAAGLARMVVVEMTGPDSQNPKKMTPERVSDIMAAGLSGERPPESATPAHEGERPPMRVRPGSRPSEIILEEGLGPLGFLDLPEEVTLRHNAFPAADWENAGLVKSPDGRFYDPSGRIVWEPGEGGQYLGRRAPEGFDVGQFSSRSGSGNGARAGEVTPAPEPPAAVAYTLFDETTGAGSIVLGNLPPAPEGRAYQLWLTDPGQQSPVSVGLLPSLEGGAGRVFFDTLAPGFAPSGYFLTLEPAAGSAQPGGPRVLSGPQIPGP